MNEKQTDRDRLTKPCDTENNTSLKRENIIVMCPYINHNT